MVTVIDDKSLAVAWELPMEQGVRPMAFEKAADGSTSRMFVQLSNLHGFVVVDFKTHEIAQRVTLPDQPVNGKAESGAPSHGMAYSLQMARLCGWPVRSPAAFLNTRCRT